MAKVVVDGDLLNMRIEAIVTAIHGLADVVQITNTLVSDIATFLKEPTTLKFFPYRMGIISSPAEKRTWWKPA